MPVIAIDSPRDVRLADYRSVGEPDLGRTRGLFVAEGRRVVQRLIEGHRFAVRSLLLNEAARCALDETLRLLDASVPVYTCAAEHFVDITGYPIHRGCLALAERPSPQRPEEVARAARLIVVLERVANADNVGGVFRSAAAFGAGGVLLCPQSCDPLYRKAIRTSMAATLSIPFARVTDWPEGLHQLRASGFTIAALTPREPSLALEVFARDVPARLALLVGAEGDGLSAAAEQAAHVRVRIPITPDVDSLNLAVATGIALSRLTAVGGPLRKQDPGATS
jgi:tRNA G18 (ribose-2'-O)-methylase SpoU